MFWRLNKTKQEAAPAGEPSLPPGGEQRSGGPARFLDPEVLGRISSLELLARTVVEGFISGLHRSPYTGFSTEFAEYRQYMPGDDLRYLDWKLLGRTDRYYIRKYRADTNSQLQVLIDTSGSMSYGAGSVTKLRYAQFLGAAVAYLANRQQDAIGLLAFDDQIRLQVPALNRTGHMRTIFGHLEQLAPGGETQLAPMIHAAAERLARRGIVVLISDFYDDPALLMKSIEHLRFRGHDVIVFHLLDRNELEFNFREAVLLEDLETEEQMHVLPELLGDGYRKALAEHLRRMQEGLASQRIDYEVLLTDQPLDHALYTFLGRRARQ